MWQVYYSSLYGVYKLLHYLFRVMVSAISLHRKRKQPKPRWAFTALAAQALCSIESGSQVHWCKLISQGTTAPGAHARPQTLN